MYDISKSPNYELTYLWFVQGAFVVVFVSLAVDSLFYAAAFNLSGHFKIIQNKIENLKFEQSTMSDVQLSQHFRQVIKYHKKIKRMITYLTEIYKPILLIQFMVASLQLCVVGYQLTLVYTYIPIFLILKLIIFRNIFSLVKTLLVY